MAARCKADIREEVWRHLESSGLAAFPRPVRGRIPNFQGSLQACCSLRELDVFSRAREVKVDPDKPLEGARLAALQAGKTLLVPTPRLRSGLFNRIVPPPGATKEMLRRCATSQGVKDYSVPVGLDGKAQVDLVVVGSVAVSEKGWRIGKGEGYADMEYAMMVSMGAVQEDTPVVTIVHDCQVLDIAEELLGDHDLTVDYILTPTKTIKTNCKRPKPQGILWHKVSSEMLGKIPILKTLWSREKQAGKDVTLQDEHPSLANTKRGTISNKEVMAANPQARAAPASAPVGQPHVESDPENPKFEGCDTMCTVFVGNLPGSLRVSELKSALRELQVVPVGLKWQGAQHRAFLHYRDQGAAHRAVSSLQGLSLGGNALRVELAKSQRSKGQGGNQWS
ncbi:Methenyltetrahydrofolate synthase domain-containing protein [Lonchura striata]|uniref:Methenyltetrahydrofolate synthase domain-containing protein n=1 Tax=Lonchura striata TaxID=40157 RepID=A0A218UIR3_9PASE|nr:methenyltetrahydrofolate synthase domain-containing protein isoform X1 [Lonchura striata domestica]OWK53252.1 Methenyltetrahydrofolate synthase domain-containing protein [Lonchura striata domestica]